MTASIATASESSTSAASMWSGDPSRIGTPRRQRSSQSRRSHRGDVSAVLSVPSSPKIDRIRRGVSFVGIFFGFFLAGYTGVLLSSSALPFWSDARLMGALFLASGASTGMAAISLILFLTGGSAGTGWRKVKRADRYSMLFELVLLAVFLGVLGSAAKPITSGHFAPLFWGGLVGIGLVIPLLIDFVGHRVQALSVVAAALVLVGGFVLRYVVLMSIQS